MIRSKEAYMKQLEREMYAHPDNDVIMAELTVHIDEKMSYLLKKDLPEEEAIQIIIEQFGHPSELAVQFGGVSTKSPTIAKVVFVLCNSFLFFLGACITFGYHLVNAQVFQIYWEALAHNSWLILFMYTGYWVLIGYQIGKEFGEKGKRLLSDTISLAIAPNLFLMLAVLFGLFPVQWFSPLLTTSFIGACIGVTFLFYPLSQIGYYFGRHQAV